MGPILLLPFHFPFVSLKRSKSTRSSLTLSAAEKRPTSVVSVPDSSVIPTATTVGVQGKVRAVTCHEGPEGVLRYIHTYRQVTLSLNSALDEGEG